MYVNNVVLGDCLELLKGLPENSIDLILTDPPYNISGTYGMLFEKGVPISNTEAWGTTFNDDRSIEDYMIFINSFGEEALRVLKQRGSIILFYDRGKPQNLMYFYNSFHFRNTLVFIKQTPSPHLHKNNYRSGFEQCAWFSKGKPKINFLSQKEMINVFYGNNKGRVTDHPTEKYVWMIRPLILRHSNKGDIVLDPMCGSGTTLVCAKQLSRRYIGMDINKKWVETSINRLSTTIVEDEIGDFFE